MQPYESLRQKLGQPFLLQGFVVSAVISLITFGLLAEIEENAIQRALHAELESFRYRVDLNANAAPANGTLLRGYYLPDPSLGGIKPATPGEESLENRFIGDSEFSVLVSDIRGKPFVLLYDRSYIQDNLQQLALILLVTTLLMTLLSFMVGYQLSRKVLQPILRLVDDVSRKATGSNQLGPQGFVESDYPRDEIGQLVRELDRFSHRIYTAMQRESDFSADVSHELRTPVAVIMGTSEVLAELPGVSEMASQRVEVIQRHALRMGQILDAMLLLGREEVRTEDDLACSIADVVDDVLADCRPLLINRPVELTVNIATCPVLAVERALVYVLISNLVRNACAHTSSGLIEVSLREFAFEVSNTTNQSGEWPSGFMKRHVRGAGSLGHGLGLSIVGRVCERLSWDLAFEPRPKGVMRARLSWGVDSAETSSLSP